MPVVRHPDPPLRAPSFSICTSPQLLGEAQPMYVLPTTCIRLYWLHGPPRGLQPRDLQMRPA